MANTLYDIAIEIHRSPNGCLHLGDHQVSDDEWGLINDGVQRGFIVQKTFQLDFDIHHFTLTQTGRQEFSLPASSHISRPASIVEWVQRLIGKAAR